MRSCAPTSDPNRVSGAKDVPGHLFLKGETYVRQVRLLPLENLQSAAANA